MVMVKPLSLGFTITLLMAEAVVHRCFSKYVFLKNSFQTCNFIKKRFRYRFFPVKFAKILRTRKKNTFLRNTSGGCFWYDPETYDTVLFNRDLNRVCLVYMFSLRFSGSKFLINFSCT